ncbi:GAF domain-containing protein [Roseateles chitinivorans]|uniref:GAF domain-containing protein n=1 Tax=Roseateles chitinivorans TaxID=2917965 RepID=UPI003D66AFC4
MTDFLLHEIDATGLLSSRPSRAPNWQREAEALSTLAEVFANTPQKLAQTLADTALALTGAQAAGISLEETDSTPQIFRWVATAGTYSCYLNGTMPRDFSPCGEVVRRNSAVLMRHMSKLYEYVSQLHEPPHEVLLVPFQHRGTPVGTVWVVSHDDQRGFDGEDLRVVQNLTRFAGAAVESVDLVKQLTELDARKDRFMALLAHEMRTPFRPSA